MEREWQREAQLVKETIERQPEMAGGHTCNTCPTKHDCQLHDDALDVKTTEEEEMPAPAGP